MLVDGKQIANELLERTAIQVQKLAAQPTLTAITCAPNFETQKYLGMKKRRAAAVGIALSIIELPETATTEEVVQTVTKAVKVSAGVVVQLPLPPQIDRDTVLAAVPADCDPDGFQYGFTAHACMAPVVGAINEIALRHKVVFKDKRVVILGAGRLVGQPVAQYLSLLGADVTVLTVDTFDAALLKKAEVIVSGIGKPRFITPDMVADKVVVFDAGTSEDGGELVGDVAPEVAKKAAVFTPVPGGIGPITIAYLLKNLVTLARQ